MSQAGQFYRSGLIETLTGDVGGAISPVAGNIDIVGGAGISVTGTPGTLTIAHSGAFSDSFPTDAGTAVPVAGDTNIFGGANINTTGAGNTVTVILDDDVTLAGFLSAGTTVSATTTVTGGTGVIATTGNVTASAGNVVATAGDIVADVGDITATAGALEAGTTLTVGTDVTFTSITDGGLIADSSGDVYASGSLLTPSGFEAWAGAGPYYDDTTLGQFDVLQGGTGYIKGLPVTWAGSQTVTGMTAGNTYAIYIDDTGTIGKTTTFNQALYEDYIVLFECLRDSTGTNIQYTVRENHPYDFQVGVSYFLHQTVGPIIENVTNGANITLSGTQKISIAGADVLSDHGLYTTISDTGGVGVTWKQMYTNGSGKWATYTSSDTFDGYWNSAGTATAPTGTKFSAYRLYVSKDDANSATPTYWAVLDDQEYNNLALAQTAVSNGDVNGTSGELAKLELAQLGYILYQQSTSTIVDVIIEKDTLRSTVSTGAGTNDAALVLTNTANFDGILSAADTNVQAALDTIDEWGKTSTNNALLVGNGTGSPIGSLAVGATGEILIGNTGADPSWSATPAVTSLTATTVYGTTFDTNVAAAGVTLSGTSLTADGTDADIDINITAKGTGQVIIDDLQLTTALTVPYGGTGATTLTDHGVLVGSGVGAITPLAVGTNGQVLLGSSGADPVFATLASADGTITFTPGAGTLDIAGTDATTAQEGVVELATDAEAIAGADTSRAIVPSSLKAKLGTQTQYGLIVGAGNTAALGALAVGATGELLVGNTGANPSWSATPSVTSITATTVYGTTFDTNVAAAGVTLTGTALTADGTDADIDINITAKGTGQVIIDDLQLSTDLEVQYGGTGVSSLTDHGVLVGSGSGAITPLAVGTNGQVLVGSNGADPVFASITSTDSSITITGGAGTLALTGTQATDSQLGSVELATDAEAIAGSDTARPIVPSSLAAKLGTQTDHGVLVGSGTTAAITALAVGTNGQVLVGSTGADPVFATVASADGSIEVTGGAGTIDLAVTGTIAVNNQTGTTYELVLADNGKIVTCTNASAITVTIPVNADVALPVGTNVLISQNGAGTVTLAPEGGVTLRSRGSLLDTAGQYAVVSATKIATDEWIIGGDLA